MAAPTMTYAWNPATLRLTITGSEALYRGSQWGANKIKIADGAGRIYGNVGGTNTDSIVSGLGTDTLVVQMANNQSLATPGSECITVAANTFKNAGNEGNGAVTSQSFYVALNETLSGITYSDVTCFIGKILSAANTEDTPLDLTAAPQHANVLAVLNTGFIAALQKCCRTESRLWLLLDQIDKFKASAKNPVDYKALDDAIADVRVNLNPRGTFAMQADGL